jgi:hypothetical protein
MEVSTPHLVSPSGATTASPDAIAQKNNSARELGHPRPKQHAHTSSAERFSSIDPSWHTPVWGAVLRRMTPWSAGFEHYGTRFLKHLGVCQIPVAWYCPGGAGQIRAGNASRMERILGLRADGRHCSV